MGSSSYSRRRSSQVVTHCLARIVRTTNATRAHPVLREATACPVRATMCSPWWCVLSRAAASQRSSPPRLHAMSVMERVRRAWVSGVPSFAAGRGRMWAADCMCGYSHASLPCRKVTDSAVLLENDAEMSSALPPRRLVHRPDASATLCCPHSRLPSPGPTLTMCYRRSRLPLVGSHNT